MKLLRSLGACLTWTGLQVLATSCSAHQSANSLWQYQSGLIQAYSSQRSLQMPMQVPMHLQMGVNLCSVALSRWQSSVWSLLSLTDARLCRCLILCICSMSHCVSLYAPVPTLCALPNTVRFTKHCELYQHCALYKSLCACITHSLRI